MADAIVRGFCRTKDSAAALLAYGVADKALYQDGRGAETFERCLASFRNRHGTLYIAPDLRVFGESKKAVAAAMSRLERARIWVTDIIHPQHTTISDMIQHASVLISGYRLRDRRRARSQGRAGGLARAQFAQARRDEAVPREFVERLVANEKLTVEEKLEILGPVFCESSLRRHYFGEAK